MVAIHAEENFSGLFNLGKTCFVLSIIQCLSTLIEIRFEIIHHFKECQACQQGLTRRKIITNDKYQKVQEFLNIMNNYIVHFL